VTRPVFLNLAVLRLPVPGLMSIGHRLSGVALVLAIPYAAHLLALSLAGAEGFARAATALTTGAAPLLLFVLFWGLLHHLLAGLRYLLLDLDLGVERPAARASAWAVLLAAPLLALLGALLGALPGVWR
jgi:succinate dehydrogenase / fumarate reductase cytochrome b subunit